MIKIKLFLTVIQQLGVPINTIFFQTIVENISRKNQ
jgi:hypothetical protein